MESLDAIRDEAAELEDFMAKCFIDGIKPPPASVRCVNHLRDVVACLDDLLSLFVENWTANGHLVRLPRRDGGYPGQCEESPHAWGVGLFYEFDNEDQVREAARLAAAEGLFTKRLESLRSKGK